MNGKSPAGARGSSAAKRVSLMAMMTALAFVLSWIERMFPPISGVVPGIKLGLANVVVLIMLYYGGFSQAAIVSLVRVLVVGFVFANPWAMLYSLAGGTLSLLMMALAKRSRLFSPVGVSIAGGVFHNLGQVALAMVVLNGPLWASLPILLVAGVVTGVATGIVATGVLRYLKALPVETGPAPNEPLTNESSINEPSIKEPLIKEPLINAPSISREEGRHDKEDVP